jgi:phosphomannomutase
MAGIFKAYDIRGIYGEMLTEDIMRDIGRAFVTFLKCRQVVIGRDMRPHSTPLFAALSEGITMQGADVVELGLSSTPMLYHAVGKLEADAGIMLTASHNPGEYNGVKLTRADAIPISGNTGLQDIERIVLERTFAEPSETSGNITQHDITGEYVEHVRRHVNMARPIRIAVDMANGMGIVESCVLEGVIEMDKLFDVLDGTFPNHEANPLNHDTYGPLRELVKSGNYDFGVAFDGDADRAGFTDEQGNIIPMDIITALIAKDILSHETGTIFYDLRSSWAVKEVIEESGGAAMMSRVGHAFIKQQMRDADAVFAGELSGHYYFRDNFFTESSSLAVICVANIVSRSELPLSELVKPIQRYSASGEINSEVKDREVVLQRIRDTYSDGHQFELDGVSVEYEDWWLNVRASNTEPYIRLNLEARTPEMMAEKRDELLGLIRSD